LSGESPYHDFIEGARTTLTYADPLGPQFGSVLVQHWLLGQRPPAFNRNALFEFRFTRGALAHRTTAPIREDGTFGPVLVEPQGGAAWGFEGVFDGSTITALFHRGGVEYRFGVEKVAECPLYPPFNGEC
jgi:hypothetical protein